MRPNAQALRVAAVICGSASTLYALSILNSVGERTPLGMAAASFCTALSAFAAAPRSRRDDLTMAVAALFGGCVGLHAVMSRGDVWTPIVGVSAGVLAAWIPGKVEGLRSDLRHARPRLSRRASDLGARSREPAQL